MSTTRHPSYMRRRQMRLMVQEQQREQRHQLRLASAALLVHARQLMALFGPSLAPPLTPGPGTVLDNAASQVEVIDQASAPADLWAALRTRLH